MTKAELESGDERDELPPNAADPLSEPTLARRVWAAYLQRGYTRKTFAAAMETTYAVVHGWDHGAQSRGISLKKLQRASQLLGYSMDELCFGKQTAIGGEPVLTAREIVALVNSLRCDDDTRQAFKEHLQAEGRYQEPTKIYVHVWISVYRQTRVRGGTKEQASAAALIEAVSAQAMAEVVASTQPELRDLSAADVAPEAQREKQTVLRQMLPAVVVKAQPRSRRS